ncbi:MAG TPA: hypothetical protein DCL73_10275 [Treponema sp.]|nr:hypothetical protein [Treponema sp.]
MLAQLLCSFGATLLISYGISIVSGGTIFMLFDFALAGMLLFCTTVMLVFSGLIKDFIFIFLPRKKTEDASFEKLKNAKAAVDLAVHTQLYSGVFISCVALVLLLYNYDIREYTGLNLGTVLLSLEYALLFMLVMSPVSTGLERRMLSVMAEDRDKENPRIGVGPGKQKLKGIVTYMIMILFFIAAFLFVQHTSMKNNKQIPAPLDVSSFLGLIFWGLSALLCSGSLHDFGRAFSVAAGVRKILPGEQNRLTGAVSLVMRVLMAAGGCMVITGCVAMLRNMEDKSALVPNTYVALIPLLYAPVFCLILLPVKAAVNRRAGTCGSGD